MQAKSTINKFKLYGTLFALGLAGGAIFLIPYIKFVFYDLQIEEGDTVVVLEGRLYKRKLK